MSTTVEIATKLADEFRTRASDYDRTGEFPFANYAAMREAGYLRAPVPEPLGGLGAGILEMSRAQQALARGCASTALAVNMHLFQVGSSADGYNNGNAAMEGILRRIANDGIVIASNGAESIVAGDWTTATTAVRKNGHYVINGRKFFCSQSVGADIIRLLARDTETDELLVVPVTRATPGVSVFETWDTMGMRASASHDIVLEDVQVPVDSVGARIPPGSPIRHPAIANIGRWFLGLVAGVYLGIAEEAREEAYKSIGGGINSNERNQALTDVLIGEMEAAWLTARSVRDQGIGELDAFPTDMQAAIAQAILCKEAVITNANLVVDKAVQIAGGRSYYKKSPLERLVRDMRAGRYHPPAAPISYQMAGERARERLLAKAL